MTEYARLSHGLSFGRAGWISGVPDDGRGVDKTLERGRFESRVKHGAHALDDRLVYAGLGTISQSTTNLRGQFKLFRVRIDQVLHPRSLSRRGAQRRLFGKGLPLVPSTDHTQISGAAELRRPHLGLSVVGRNSDSITSGRCKMRCNAMWSSSNACNKKPD
ncbi:hypothetical protein PG991_000001 [Apiospora marii]|uniref:Uncharacterized protein n=1 Tax=Apiospora marii TaxID=335849 RepID=A0ABR1T0W6_9PEZI